MRGKLRCAATACLAFVVALVLATGCSSPSPRAIDRLESNLSEKKLAEAERARLGTIGLVAPRFPPRIELDTPDTSKGSAAGKGAVHGMGVLWGECVKVGAAAPQLGTGIVALFGCTVLTPVVAAGGAVYGVVKAPSEADVEQARQRIDTVFAQIRIQETLRERVFAAAKSGSNYTVVDLVNDGPSAPDASVDYRSLDREGITTVLEVAVANLALHGSGVDLPLKLTMNAQARLLSVSENRVLYSNAYVYRSEQRPFSEWTAGDAQALRAAYERGYQDLAGQIVQTIRSQRPDEVPQPDEDFVNCVAAGERLWTYRSKCD
jgi:hypothetical protein